VSKLTEAVEKHTAKAYKPKHDLKILTIDIETVPNDVYTWGLWNQNISISQIKKPGGVFAFAAKWVGKSEVFFHSDHHDGHREMLQAAWDLLNEADVVVTYNGISFDIPHLQWEFVQAGMSPPKPYKQIDLLRVVRKQFRAPSKKLDYISQQLGIGHKTHHSGFELWVKCMEGDEAAWKKMATYNKQDVRLTEKLYHYLLPWLTQVPHLGQMEGNEHSCPYCGGVKLRRDGTAHAFVTSYRLYECLNCHAWVRGTQKLQDATRTRPMKIN
jgi:DNA polymerase elongation subunit (family B)